MQGCLFLRLVKGGADYGLEKMLAFRAYQVERALTTKRFAHLQAAAAHVIEKEPIDSSD